MARLLVLTLLIFSFACGSPCRPPSGHESLLVHGHLEAGSTFRAPFGERLSLLLTPTEFGWVIRVEEMGREENLAGLTPPWHFVPNPIFVEGWHFRNTENTGPNDGSVNAPQGVRGFIFSPEVGRTLEYSGSATPESVVHRVRDFGRGYLTLTSYRLTPAARGERASFEEISFDVCLIWRSDTQ